MITVLYPVNDLRIGGAERQLLELSSGLDRSRFRPLVAPLYPGGALEPDFRAAGVELIQLRRAHKYDFAPLLRAAAIIRQHRVDVVQPFLSPATLFGLLPSVLTSRAVRIVTERCGVRRSRGIGNKAYRYVEDLLSQSADAVIPNSEAGKMDLLHRGIRADRVQVIYNGINLHRLEADPAHVAQIRARLRVPENGRVVGVLASLTPPKGHDTFLRAASALAARLPDVRFALVGDGPLRGKLENLAADLGVGALVEFFGYQRNVADFLGAFDMLVSPSRDNEGTSNSILEAMALGVPIVAADVGGNREVVEDGVTGWLVPVDDEHALASAMEGVLRDVSGSRETPAAAARMVRTRFGLRRMVAEYEELYTRLLQQRARERVGAPRLAGVQRTRA